MRPEVVTFLESTGIGVRPYEQALAALCSPEGVTRTDIVHITFLPRRQVDALLHALGDHVVGDPQTDAVRLRADVIGDYDRYTWRSDMDRVHSPQSILQTSTDRADAPAPKPALDHVPATAETLDLRATHLARHYAIDGRHVVFLGDHDLTSIVLGSMHTGARLTVIDVDDDVLAYIRALADERGLDITCLWADLRTGSPAGGTGGADLVFTDPPYTAEGVSLFLARALELLAPRTDPRIVMAFGHSREHPALGLKVQKAILDLELVIDALTPHFHEYDGAEAIGSVADDYVLAPTKRSRAAAARRLARGGAAIYTHGGESIEAAAGSVSGATTMSGLLGGPRRPGAQRLVADLSGDPGAWLARALMFATVAGAELTVRNNHANVSNERGQRALCELFDGVLSLTFRRNVPDTRHAVVVAEPIASAPDDPPRTIARRQLLGHPHALVATAWRDAIVKSSRATATRITNAEARSVVDAADGPLARYRAVRVVDLPIDVLIELITLAPTTPSAG